MTTQATTNLSELSIRELQARFFEVVGEQTRCPNRTFLIRRIEQALRPQNAADADETPAETHEEQEQQAPAEPAVDEQSAPPVAPTRIPLTTVRKKKTKAARPERGRFKDMTIDELQAMYLQKVGRPTASTDKGYLQWKIREAEKGRIPIGPRESRTRDQAGSADVKILPLRLSADAVTALDAAWKTHGMKSRMELFRKALKHYLKRIGATEAAAVFGGKHRGEEP